MSEDSMRILHPLPAGAPVTAWRLFFDAGRRPGLLAMAVVLALAGCGGPNGIIAPGIRSAADRRSLKEQEQVHRERFHRTGAPKSIRWLKAHSIQPGMTVEEVNTTFGRDGELIIADRRFKTGAGYRRGDSVYKWGPDSDGHSHFLIFREGRLVNFRPAEYAD